MTDDRFDELMRDAAQTYRTPPQPDFEGMWNGIERQMDHGATPPRGVHLTRYLAIAATLVGGMILARAVNDRELSERILAACRAQINRAASP